MITISLIGGLENNMKNKKNVLLVLFIIVVLILFHSTIFYRIIKERISESKVEDYNISNRSFIQSPDKIMICFDFNQNGKDLGAYATTSKTLFLRTTDSDVVRHEALHYLLYRDTTLTEEQQHKFISDLKEMERQIFRMTYQ